MKKYLLSVSFLIAVTCQAQIKNISIQAGTNYPLIKDAEKKIETISLPIPNSTGYTSITRSVYGATRASFDSFIGYQIGGQLDYALGSKFFLTSGLSISYLRFQRTITVSDLTLAVDQPVQPPTITPVGQPFGSIYGGFTLRDAEGNIVLTNPAALKVSDNVGKTTSLSLQLPLLAGTSFLKEKIEVRIGPVFSYLLHATQIKEEYTSITSRSEYKDSSKEAFNEFQAGGMLQTTYRVGQKIGIDLSAQKFFTPIYKSDDNVAKSKYNVVALGLSYHL